MTEPRVFPQGFLAPEPGACSILLVRHGQSQAVIEGQSLPLVDGQGDPPLSELGEWQAERVGERLRDTPISAIYASTMQRTQQTCAPLAAYRGITPTIDSDLREVHLGEYEGGLFRIKSADNDPAVLEMRRTGDWGAIPGAESNDDLRSRTVAAIERIAMSHPDEMVGVFCHGGVIAALLAHAADTRHFAFRGARNGSISHLYVSEQEWLVRAFNDASHNGDFHAESGPGEGGDAPRMTDQSV